MNRGLEAFNRIKNDTYGMEAEPLGVHMESIDIEIVENYLHYANRFKIMCRALKQGYIYSKYYNGKEFAYLKFIVSSFEYMPKSGKFLLTSEYMMNEHGYDLKDYGTSWFLEEDGSE